MPALNNLSVTERSDLIAEANNFQAHADDVKKTTTAMLNSIGQLTSVYDDESTHKYVEKFNALSDDMEKLYKDCSDYSTKLNEIANNYNSAVESNIGTVSGLQTDIAMS